MSRRDFFTILLGTVGTTAALVVPITALRVYLWHRQGVPVTWF